MRAPLVLISVRVKPSNIRYTSCCAAIDRAARRSLRRDAGGLCERHGDRHLPGDAGVEIVRLHDHVLDAQLGELLLHGPALPPPPGEGERRGPGGSSSPPSPRSRNRNRPRKTPPRAWSAPPAGRTRASSRPPRAPGPCPRG